jgi:hypothetical protein
MLMSFNFASYCTLALGTLIFFLAIDLETFKTKKLLEQLV